MSCVLRSLASDTLLVLCLSELHFGFYLSLSVKSFTKFSNLKKKMPLKIKVEKREIFIFLLPDLIFTDIVG